MNTLIAARYAELGKFYVLGNNLRHICIYKGKVIKFWSPNEGVTVTTLDRTITQLSECTDWDWKPAPAYRPFASAAEFQPYETKFWRYKDDVSSQRRAPMSYADNGHYGDPWDRGFDNKVFCDGTPFGFRLPN